MHTCVHNCASGFLKKISYDELLLFFLKLKWEGRTWSWENCPWWGFKNDKTS